MSILGRTKVAGIPAGFKELQVTLGDVTLNYVVGPENGLPLLLIPGQMEAWQGYKRVLPELSTRFHVFVPDLRGHGKSTWTPGHYSYNICGNDLKAFIREVIGRPALVAGLSSGAVLTIWLAANAPDDVLAIISEDPPIFSSVWPRIQEEKFMCRNFEVAIETMGGEEERDPAKYLAQMGAPTEGKSELLMIPPFIVNFISFLFRLNQTLRPNCPYDAPLLPFDIRTGAKFLSEYDTDFSRATIDGDLSKNFSPEETLKRVKCPMFLLWAGATRHETWGILGAMDDDDLQRVMELVNDFRFVKIAGQHAIHMTHPREYIDELVKFVDDLQANNKLPSQKP
ncbi:MAG: alpha/beta hydrolase [Anaerolineae bacterium]|nr:alpha/beta hydrolase [Anaerolineae bacterium]